MVTIRDVAKKAGVSIKTVSRVVNKSENVSESTRAKVLAAIEELNYRPNAFARGLVTKTSRMLGVTVPDICNPYFAEVVRGIEDAAYAAGYSVFICNTEENETKELDYLGALQEKQVDGMVLCSSRLKQERIQRLLESGSPSVFVNREFEGFSGYRILVDEFSVGYSAVEHLAERGRNRIGYIGGPGDGINTSSKLTGYLEGCRKLNLGPASGRRVSVHPSIEGGYTGAEELLRGSEPSGLDGLFTYNDLVAVGAMDYLREQGIRVPQDVAVIGCDDIPLASYVHPNLTTFRIPKYEMGKKAVELLLTILSADGEEDGEEQDEELCTFFQPQLVVRSSTAVI